MLRSTSFDNYRPVVETFVKVKILRAIYVGGEPREVGSIASVPLSDAQALATVGRVELL